MLIKIFDKLMKQKVTQKETRTCLMVNDLITVNIYSLNFMMIFICEIVGDREAAFKQYSEAMEIIEFSRRMLALKDKWIKTLEASRTVILQIVDDLQKENRDLKVRLNSVQQERDRLLQDLIMLQHNHSKCLAELEDERKDKQMYQQRSEHI